MVEEYKKNYPFKSNFITLGGVNYHYLDEGNGQPIVMLHGNPTWSFYYRHLVIGLRGSYRVVVPDHMGCGLSDKPQNYNYTLAQHIENLEILLDTLHLKNITLVLHDWGGAIGMGWAVRHIESVKNIVVLNTAAFILPRIPFRINICRIPIFGDVAVRVFNGFAEMALYMASNKKDRMTKEVKRGYIWPYNSYKNRIAILRFVQDIPINYNIASYSTMNKIEQKLACFKDHPMLIIWGEKDFCFNGYFLDRWRQLFAKAEVRKLPDAGHYVAEDAWEFIIPCIDEFCKKH